jgi:hypothetical protein
MDTPDKEPSGGDRTVEERIEAALTPKEVETEEAEPEGETAEAAEATEEETEEAVVEAEEELFEIEHEGKKARVPKELKDAFLRQADYTQKTQSVAEEKRQIAEERQLLQLNAQVEAAVAEQMVELRGLVNLSKQYEAAIQQAITAGDVAQIATLSAQNSILQRQIDDKAGEVRTKKNEQAQLLDYEKQQRRMRADEEAGRKIPNFSHETKKDLVQAGRALGFLDAELKEVDDPRVYQALWKAAQWDKLQTSKANVTKKVAEAPKTLPAKGQSTQAKSSTVKTLSDSLKRTGRADYAERLIEQRLLGKR